MPVLSRDSHGWLLSTVGHLQRQFVSLWFGFDLQSANMAADLFPSGIPHLLSQVIQAYCATSRQRNTLAQRLHFPLAHVVQVDGSCSAIQYQRI